MERFILNKLSEHLKSYVDLQATSFQGLSIRKLSIKTKLMEELSQVLGIPLILTSGTIQLIRINLPWQKLLSASKEQPFIITIENVKINAKLPNDMQIGYIHRKKQKLIQQFMHKFNKRQQSQFAFLNKIKQYFLGSLLIELKNLQLQIGVHMKHPITVVTSVRSLKFLKDSKSNNSKFDMDRLSLGYRLGNQTKQQWIIHQASLRFASEHLSNHESLNKLYVKKLNVQFTNQNFNDVRWIISLIHWHNSFLEVPQPVWEHKPPIIGKVVVNQKINYIARAMDFKIRQNKYLGKILANRRLYLKLFERYRKDPRNMAVKEELEQLELKMDVWRVQQYRKFSILRSQPQNRIHIIKTIKVIDSKMNTLSNLSKKKSVEPPPPPEYEIQKNEKEEQLEQVGWLRFWFRNRDEKKLLFQLEDTLDKLEQENKNLRSHFELQIQEIKIQITIKSHSGKQPFLNIISTNNIFRITKDPLSEEGTKEIQFMNQKSQNEEIVLTQNSIKSNNDSDDTIQTNIEIRKKFSIERLLIEYDQYCGHENSHRFLLHEIKKGGQFGQTEEEDEFEDIQNFLEYSSVRYPGHFKRSQMSILPVLISFNEETIEKLSVFKLQKINNNFQDAEHKILEQNIFVKEQKNKQKSFFTANLSAWIKIPESMYQDPCQETFLSLENIKYKEEKNHSIQVDVDHIGVKCVVCVQKEQEMSLSIKQSYEKSEPRLTLETISIMSTSLRSKIQYHDSVDKIIIQITPITISFTTIHHLNQFLKLALKLKPKSKTSRPSLAKLRYIRRKQSIGEQFIDACSNLNQHIIRSTILSQKTRQQKYIVKEKKDTQIAISVDRITVQLQEDQLVFDHARVKIFEFRDSQTLISEEDKTLTINIKNIKKTLANAKFQLEQLSKILENSGESLSQPDPSDKKIHPHHQMQRQVMAITISSLDLKLIIQDGPQQKIKMSLSHIEFERRKDAAVDVRLNCELGYFPNLDNILKKKSKQRMRDEPLFETIVQKFNLKYEHRPQYNKDEKYLCLHQLKVNLKPILIKQMKEIFQKLKTPEHKIYKIINKTTTPISLMTNGNAYIDFPHLAEATTTDSTCNFIVHGCKETLNLSREAGTERYKIAGRLQLIKKIENEFQYSLQSNLRLTNHQQCVIWVRILDFKGKMPRKKSLNEEKTYQMLSTARNKVSIFEEEGVLEGKIIKRASSLNKRADQTQSPLFSGKDIPYKKTHLKKISNERSSSDEKDRMSFGSEQDDRGLKNPFYYPSPAAKEKHFTRKNQHKSKKKISDSSFPSAYHRERSSSNESKRKIAKFGSLKNSQKKYEESGSVNFEQVLCLPIKPLETIQLLMYSESLAIQLFQAPIRQSSEKYQIFQISDAINFPNTELLLNSFEPERTEIRTISERIVIRTEVEPAFDSSNNMIYNMNILSPVVFINNLPITVKYRYSKEEVDLMETIKLAGKEIRKRSFQAIPMECVPPLKLSRVRKIPYVEITDMEIMVDDYERTFRLNEIIESMNKKRQEQKGKKQKQQEILLTQNSEREKIKGQEVLQNQKERELSQEEEQAEEQSCRELLRLHNCNSSLQMVIQIKITKHIMKIIIYPQYVFLNMTGIDLHLQILQENYSYPSFSLEKLTQMVYFKEYLKMNDERLATHDVLQQLYEEYKNNIFMFTGSLEKNARRRMIYANHDCFQPVNVFDSADLLSSSGNARQKMVQYGHKRIKIVTRKVSISPFTNLVIFMPSLLIINKSDWGFFIKGQAESLKKLPKHSIEYAMISSIVAVQACEEQDDILYNEWMKITLQTLGTIYYSKQMTSSNGYQSREYELRKKRLRKAPKIFYRIVMTKYQYGYQMLIEESQYPPVSFINKCSARVQIKEENQNIMEQMQTNQMAQYASKIPHYSPLFKVSLLENYQFKGLGTFSLEESPSTKKLSDNIQVKIEEYKDKKIIIIQDGGDKADPQIRNMLLEMVKRFIIKVEEFQFSILTNKNKQLSCLCVKDLQINQETKNTKKYLKLTIMNIESYSYNSLQPSYLFYSSKKIIYANKQQPVNLQNSMLGKTFTNNPEGGMFKNLFQAADSKQNSQALVSLEIVIDYHKHATILQKCRIKIRPITVVIDANTLIDYLKYYYQEVKTLIGVIEKHRQIANQKPKQNVVVRGVNKMQKLKKRSSFSSAQLSKFEQPYQQNSQASSEQNSFMNRNFVIENFKWQGIEITIKCENLNNLCLFVEKRSISYLLKFITWMGDLRPIYFNPTQIEYEQYTLSKIISQIDAKTVIKEFTQLLLHYPLQQFYHVLFLGSKLLGINDMGDDAESFSEKVNTLTKIMKAGYKLTKLIFISNDPAENRFDRYRRQYLEKMKQRHVEQKGTFIEEVVDRILQLKYSQWNYNKNYPTKKLQTRVSRYQRYSPSSKLAPYDQIKSQIKVAIDSQISNKVFRQIKYSFRINNDYLLGTTEDWFVLYSVKRGSKDEWIVVRPEQVAALRLEVVRVKRVLKRQLVIILSLDEEQGSLSSAQKLDNKKGIKTFVFEDPQIEPPTVKELNEELHSLRLSNCY